MAILIDVPFAVAVFLIPNIISNAWQTWRYQADIPDRGFALNFAISGVVGAGIGTVALARSSSSVLTTAVALIVLVYVVFRLAKPGWSLSWRVARQAAGPVGALGGFFQGAIGLSGPVSATFVNAVGLSRRSFIYTMSLYFLAMTMIQLPVQIVFGIMTLEIMTYGFVALGPMAVGMFLGDISVRRVSRTTFDRVIFVILTLLALRLLAENVL